MIKSLDHWPDLGSDLDLYTSANSADVIRVVSETFDAQLHPRSWGDRLANKWNFMVPGPPEAVEVHVGRLGQTGEHVSLAHGLVMRARSIHLEAYVFPVEAAEDRLMIAILQRIYRHFYARLCDIADTAQLIDDDGVELCTPSLTSRNLRDMGRGGDVPLDRIRLRSPIPWERA